MSLIGFDDLPLRDPGDLTPRLVGCLSPRALQLRADLPVGRHEAMPPAEQVKVRLGIFGSGGSHVYDDADAARLAAYAGPLLADIGSYMKGRYIRPVITTSDHDVRRGIQAGDRSSQPRAGVWHSDDKTPRETTLLMYLVLSGQETYNTLYSRSGAGRAQKIPAPGDIGQIGANGVLELTRGTLHRSAENFDAITGDWDLSRIDTMTDIAVPPPRGITHLRHGLQRGLRLLGR